MNGCFLAWLFRSRVVVIGLLTLVLIPGCYERVVDGQESIYRFAWWLGLLVIAGGLLGVPVGWLLRRWSRKWGFALMCMAPILLIIVAPAMYSDHVVVDDEHFEDRFGFWFHPSTTTVRFQDLREIHYVGVPDNRGRINYELRCISKTGQTEVVPAGDLAKNAVPEILSRAKARGVEVVSEEAGDGGP